MLLTKKYRNITLLCSKGIRYNSDEVKTSLNRINEQLKFSAYQPKNIENKSNVTTCQQATSNENFSMIFPPPNVTGDIHLGHTLTATIQDVIVRWKQSQGINTQWIFGVDHAGIATQVVVEKVLFKKYGKSRHEIGKKAFLEEIHNWKNDKANNIIKDLQRIGASFNWEREYFTMDKKHSNAVDEAFIRLFEKGIIYRASSLINWSCALESAISDVEVENVEIQGKTSLSIPNYDDPVTFGHLYEIVYKVVNSNEEIIVATTRPETILGDTAIAVNPNDERYSHLANAKVTHPYRQNEEIPIILDESVDASFGTGAVKITPGHDRNDFELAARHNLKTIQVLDECGKIRNEFKDFSQLPRFIAREKIINDLAEKKLLFNIREHDMILPICSRSKDVIEFMLKDQWFVSCREMAKKAVEVVKNGKLKIIPDAFERDWYRWLDTNCRDWCISRQLWWGHQCPVYRVTKTDGSFSWVAGRSVKEVTDKIGNSNYTSIERDTDVLDTWFSSALLPFSINGWPNEIDKNNFPLSLMETGHDILFFWVARMVMLSMELTGEIPFKEVLLHGIVCDAFGRKMSKSLGNVISPDQIISGATLSDLQKEVEESVEKGIIAKSELKKSLEGQKRMFPTGIQECGVDALRFTLCSQNVKQHFIKFDVNECVANKLFFNKLWQATKYAINFAETRRLDIRCMSDIQKDQLNGMDLWILSRLASTLKIVKQSIANYNFHLATAALRTFFTHDFCDVYVETTKVDEKREKIGSAHVLNLCLALGLKEMSIFTPFLCEELLQYLPKNLKMPLESFINNQLDANISEILEVCKSVRELKANLNVTKKTNAEIVILTDTEKQKDLLLEYKTHMEHLTFSNQIKITGNAKEFENFTAKSAAGSGCSVGIKLLDNNQVKNSVSDVNSKKLMKLEVELQNMLNIVTNEGYREKASEKVKEKHQEKIEKLRKNIKVLTDSLG